MRGAKGRIARRFLLLVMLCVLLVQFASSFEIVSKSSAGWDSKTREENYYDLILDISPAQSNATRYVSCPGGFTGVGSNTSECLHVPHYQSSTNLSPLVLSTCSAVASPNATYSCGVTDEFAQTGKLVSMGNDSRMMYGFLNSVRALAGNASYSGSPTISYGATMCWRFHTTRDVLNKSMCDDNAIDADANAADAMLVCADNPNFAASLRAECAATGVQLVDAIIQHNYFSGSFSSQYYTKANASVLMAGGGNVRSAPTNSGFGYSGYPAVLMAMFGRAYGNTGNATYCAYAHNTSLNVFYASNWTGTGALTGMPPGKEWKWNATSGRIHAVCTNNCGPDQWEYDDAPRLARWGEALLVMNESGCTPTADEVGFLGNWTQTTSTTGSACYSPTAYSHRYYANATCFGGSNGGFYEHEGMGCGIDLYFNQSNVATNCIDAITSHYNRVTKKWDGTGDFGIYRQMFAINNMGIALNLDDYSPAAAACDVDHAGADWNVTSATNASGYHCNIRDFWLQPGVNLTIDAFNGTNSTGWLKINATRNAYVYGIIAGDGRGHGGGSGGGGGGGDQNAVDDSFAGGPAGNATNQNGTNGTAGSAASGAGGRTGGAGGAGGAGSPGTGAGAGGAADVFGAGQADRNGGVGTSAAANSDATPVINATMGRGGGGGGGGGGGASQSGNAGNGGGGGGMGADGGSYLILIARNAARVNGTLLLRAGQLSCGAGQDGIVQGAGGAGAGNSLANCAASNGGSATAQGFQDGPGTGGRGGDAGGGMSVLAANTLDLTGAVLNVSGSAVSTNGTIKILYKTAVTANGTYAGYSSLVYSNISDSWFQDTAIVWAQNLSNITQNWNTSIYLDANASSVSAECLVSAYSSNDSNFPINATTGIINLSANISKVGTRYLAISASDTCANTISQTILVNITYTPIALSSVSITPSPTGTATPLSCALNVSNPDASSVSNTTRWYRNGTLQPSLENVTSVATGNLSLGDSWTCSAQVRDAITTAGFTNSSTLVLGDLTPPLLRSFTLSASTVVVNTETTTASVNCTDNEAVASVRVEITEPSTAKTNFTASLSAGLYLYTYPPGVAGVYSVRAFCLDGSNNVNSSSALNFTAIAPAPPAGGGGGGGGGGDSDGPAACAFTVVKPTNGFVNVRCPAGEASKGFSIVLYNAQPVTRTYALSVKNVSCALEEKTFEIAGQTQKSVLVSGCACPASGVIEGDIAIASDTCTKEVPVQLFESYFGRILGSQEFLFRALFGTFLLAMSVLALVVIARRT